MRSYYQTGCVYICVLDVTVRQKYKASIISVCLCQTFSKLVLGHQFPLPALLPTLMLPSPFTLAPSLVLPLSASKDAGSSQVGIS